MEYARICKTALRGRYCLKSDYGRDYASEADLEDTSISDREMELLRSAVRFNQKIELEAIDGRVVVHAGGRTFDGEHLDYIEAVAGLCRRGLLFPSPPPPDVPLSFRLTRDVHAIVESADRPNAIQEQPANVRGY